MLPSPLLPPAGTTTPPRATTCACGHERDSHHRGVAVCRKISCPCAGYHAHVPDPRTPSV